MKKGILVLALSLVMIFSVFASGSSESSSGQSLTVLNWGNVAEETLAQASIDEFMAENPDVTVEQTCVPVVEWTDYITRWSTMITSGNAPDVVCIAFECSQMAQANDLVMPLNDIIESDPELSALVQEYTPAILSGISDGDTIYGLPTGTQTMVMYYNKEMFDAAGLEYPTDDWTWDDFYEAAKALTKDGVYGFGLSNSYFQLVPWWISNGTNLVADDNITPTVNDPKMIEAVTFLNKLVDEGITPDPISSDVYTMFSQKKVAMVGAGRWCLPAWIEAGMNNDNFDSVQWPQNNGKGTVYGGSAWCISSSTDNLDLATELLKKFVSREAITALAADGQQVPALKSLALDPEIMGTTPDNIDGLWEAVSTATVCPAPVYYGDLNVAFMNALEQIFTNQMSVEDALNQTQAQMEALAASV